MPNATPLAPSLSPPELARMEPLRPLDVRTVNAAMREYQQGLQAILDADDYQAFADRGGDPKRFVKRSGWRKIATWFTLDLLINPTSITVDRDEHGNPLRARVVGRVVAPNGRVAEDVGACSITEPRQFNRPENDLITTAATRALNRATSNLVGMGAVTAEEVLDDVEPLLPAWAQQAPEALIAEMIGRLTELVGKERAELFARALANRYGYTPNIATGFVKALHSMLSATRAEATDETASAVTGGE